jgi:hypothetical protein
LSLTAYKYVYDNERIYKDMLSSFRTWMEFGGPIVDNGPIKATPSQDRRPDLKSGGLSDKSIPKPMRPEPTTSAFPTYGGPALPQIGRKQVVRTV